MVLVPSLLELEQKAPSGSLFSRGFYVGTAAPTYVPSDWVFLDISADYVVAHDPQVNSQQSTRGTLTVVTIGDVYSLESPHDSPEAICDELSRRAVASRRSYLELLDELHGRYVVMAIDSSRQTLGLLHDATGMRSVYYSEAGSTASSHAALVAANVGATPQALDVNGYGSPGQLTPYHGVLLLPPNQELNLAAGSIQRYWPRKRVHELERDVAVGQAEQLLQSTLTGILGRHEKVLVSLTAGTDSRVTLATALATGRAGDLDFFTYCWNNGKWIDRADQKVAGEIASDYNLSHSLIDLSQEQGPDEVTESILGMNAYRVHSRVLVAAYSRRYAGTDTVHLRSNLSEIVRTFYLKKSPTPRPKSGVDLASIYRRSIGQAAQPTQESWENAERAFEQMFSNTEFAKASRKYDPRDLMYWEHRMGSWHSQVVLESDIAFDTLSLYNSRAALTSLLSAPLSVRMDDGHMRAMVGNADARLLDYPFNPGPKRVKSNRNGEMAVQEDRNTQSWLERLCFGRPS